MLYSTSDLIYRSVIDTLMQDFFPQKSVMFTFTEYISICIVIIAVIHVVLI